MAGPKPTTVDVTPEERVEVERLVRAHGTAQQVALRAQIILLAGAGVSTVEISARVGLSRKAVRLWRDRSRQPGRDPPEGPEHRSALGRRAPAWRARAHRGGAGLRDHRAGLRGAPRVRASDQPVDRAGDRRRGDPAGHCGDDLASARGAALKKGGLQPHLVRYWLTSAQEEDVAPKVEELCTLYQQAAELATRGERVLSTDELTGVQALERAHPGLPLAPGKVEQHEFEYIRHGATTFILNRDVVKRAGRGPLLWADAHGGRLS